jgi:hypothetical protein
MQVGITVSAADGDDRTAELTRELLRDIRSDADPRAYLPTKNALPDSKGDLAILGQIALAHGLWPIRVLVAWLDGLVEILVSVEFTGSPRDNPLDS